ncbi:MAG: hypothetical protein AAGG02_21415 [Cyanobacteria bacterium P01_H01_bin.15]
MKLFALSTLALIASIAALTTPADAGAPYRDGQHPIFGNPNPTQTNR